MSEVLFLEKAGQLQNIQVTLRTSKAFSRKEFVATQAFTLKK